MKNLLLLALIFFAQQMGAMEASCQLVGKEDVINWAMNNNGEPPYIKDIIFEFSKKLNVLAKEKGLNSSREKLAWLLTMHGVVNVALNTIHEEASCPTEVAAQSALCAAMAAARDATLKVAKEEIINVALGAVKNEVSGAGIGAALRHAIKEAWNSVWGLALGGNRHADRQVRRIAYRIMEWRVLNGVLANLNSIVDKAFTAVLGVLPLEIEGEDLFKNPEVLADFFTNYFDELSFDSMLFLAPWLTHVTPISIVSDKHQELFRVFECYWPVVKQLFIALSDNESEFKKIA